jgi:hypothetical protein
VEADLDTCIRAAFEGGISSDAIADLITAADAAAEKAGQMAAVARARALNPALASNGVKEARQQMEDAAFQRDRLQVAVTKLRERLVAVKGDEENARRERAYQAVEAERDRLAEELKSYPEIAARLADLLVRIVANDAEIERINAHALPRERGRLLSAELVARGLAGWVLNAQPLAKRLTDELRLPAFELRPGSDGYLWPR